MDLRSYLRELPESMDFEDSKSLEIALYKAFYFSLSGQGEFIESLFEVSSQEIFPWDVQEYDEEPFYKKTCQNSYEHPSNEVCGRILGRGETVYRCDDCGYDPTCVICEKCFRHTDHIDHKIFSYKSNGNVGMCDCGDESAFVKKLNCRCIRKPGKLPPKFEEAIRDTIEIALDYILDVTNFSVAQLPFIHSHINAPGCDLTSEVLSDAGSLSSSKYGGTDVNSPNEWYIILWNDEKHVYPEAEAGIRAATSLSASQAKTIASDINAHGRHQIKEGSSPQELLESQKLAEKDGMVAMICSARDSIRDDIVTFTLKWLKDVSSFDVHSGVKTYARKCIAELLLEPGYKFENHVPVELLASRTPDLRQKCFESGIPFGGELLNLSHIKKKQEKLADINLTSPMSEFVERDETIKLANSRLQYFFAFEVRFSSSCRKLFTSTVLPIMTSTLDTKKKFAEQYVDVLPTLMSIFAASDREEELASVSQIAIQLFTCPLTNQFILESGRFNNIIGPAGFYLEEQTSQPNEDKIPNTMTLVYDIESKRAKASVQKIALAYADVIAKLVTSNDSKSVITYTIFNENLYYLLFFLRCFQSFLPQVRRYGDHIERESLRDFVAFLQRGIPALEIVGDAVSSKIEINQNQLEHAISVISKFLHTRPEPSQNYLVSVDPTSLLNPVNSLLALLWQKVTSLKDSGRLFGREGFHISEYSLRAIVMSSQVKVGLWIRNGLAVSKQAICYADSKISEISLYGDVFLNQMALLYRAPEDVLRHFAEMWQLEAWTSGIYDPAKVDLYESNDWEPANRAELSIKTYDDRWGVMCEQFILFLYNCLTDRSLFYQEDPKAIAREKTKKELCYNLCEGPECYDDIRTGMLSDSFNDSEFDKILKECADFQPPSGFTDAGMYRLKDETFAQLDPFNTLDVGISQTVYEALVAHSKQKVRSANQADFLLMEPKFIRCGDPEVEKNLGEFTRSEPFAEMLYHLFRVAIDSNHEEYVPHLLQLVHACILDGQYSHGPGFLSKVYGIYKIPHQLYKIFNSEAAAHISHKASHLIELMITLDGTIADDLRESIGQKNLDALENKKSTRNKKPKHSSASDRKAKIMRKFEAQRQLFLEKQEGDELAMDDGSNSGNNDQQLFERCVSCGELQDNEEPFGICFSASKSYIFATLPDSDNPHYDHKEFQRAFGDDGDRFSSEHLFVESVGKSFREARFVGTSCTHGIHFECLKSSLSGMFTCPLCHNAYDEIIPTFAAPSVNQFLPDKLIFEEPAEDFRHRSLDKARAIFDSTVHSSYVSTTPTELKLVPKLPLRLVRKDNLGNIIDQICYLIADTVVANEMAMRMDGPDNFGNLFEQSSSAFKKQIQTLIQGFSFFSCREMTKLEALSLDLPKADTFPSGFREVVFLFLTTEFSLKTAMRYVYSEFVGNILKTLVTGHHLCLRELDTGKLQTLSDTESEIFKRFWGYAVYDPDNLYSEKYYPVLEKCVLPFLRCCALLMDVVLSTKNAESEFVSHHRFNGFQAKVDQQDYNYNTDALCDILELPRLFDFVTRFLNEFESEGSTASSGRSLTFEVKVLQKSVLESGIPPRPISYPNLPRLVQLPENYNEIRKSKSWNDTKFTSVCLICGATLFEGREEEHCEESEQCSSPSLIFYLDNLIRITVRVKHDTSKRSMVIHGPYMTEHGEVVTANRQGKATLNHTRYDQLNKMYFNQDLVGYVTRSTFGETRRELGLVPPENIAQAGEAARMLVETFQDVLLMGEMPDAQEEDEDFGETPFENESDEAWFV